VRDATTGQLVPLAERGGLLGVCVHVRRSGGPANAADLRLLLVADVLMRVVELTGVQVLIAVSGVRPDAAADLHVTADRWAIRPPIAVAPGGDPARTLGAPISVHIVEATMPRSALAGIALAVGPVTGDAVSEHVDPAAVRLTLLSRRYAEPADLRAGTAADGRLRQWRALVARWASSPSRPIPSRFREQAEASLGDDLDTPGVLRLLDDIAADQTVADGAKFETFVFLDRVLGLGLTSAIGQEG
jgi:hypothetical protein